MSLFKSKRQSNQFDISAFQVKERIEPIANDLESVNDDIGKILGHIDYLRGYTTNVVDLSNKEFVKDLIRLCTESLTKIYEINSVITEVSDELIILMAAGQVSPNAVTASMQSFQLFDDGLRELKSDLKLALLDLGVNKTQAIRILKKSWETAKINKPIGILKIEKLRNGVNEWDWITELTWRDTSID